MEFQKKLIQPKDRVASWASGKDGEITLLDVVKHAKPTILIGVSGQPGLFTEDIIKEMAKQVERPIVFPLSNPTSRIEATPADILAWTKGQAIIATGSPFTPVDYDGRSYPIGQCNKQLYFSGHGPGNSGQSARAMSPDGMFMAASHALSETAPALKDPQASLLPPLTEVREVGTQIA